MREVSDLSSLLLRNKCKMNLNEAGTQTLVFTLIKSMDTPMLRALITKEEKISYSLFTVIHLKVVRGIKLC